MRKPLNATIKYRVIGIWICINIIIGIFIALMLSIGMEQVIFKDLLVFSQISVHVVATISIITAYALGYVNHHRPLWFILIANSIGVLLAALAGIQVAIFIINNTGCIENLPYINKIFTRLTLPVLLLALTCTIIGIFIERSKHKRIALLHDNKELHKKLSHVESLIKNESGFTITEKDNHYILKYNDIIYLSSYGRKTIIHTEQKDFEIAQILKKIEEKLPDEYFIRIHKQFIVSIAHVHRMRYHHGGRYMLFLWDEDETMLPVGGVYTQRIKEKLGVQIITS